MAKCLERAIQVDAEDVSSLGVVYAESTLDDWGLEGERIRNLEICIE
jgi:hypothetical protein